MNICYGLQMSNKNKKLKKLSISTSFRYLKQRDVATRMNIQLKQMKSNKQDAQNLQNYLKWISKLLVF